MHANAVCGCTTCFFARKLNYDNYTHDCRQNSIFGPLMPTPWHQRASNKSSVTSGPCLVDLHRDSSGSPTGLQTGVEASRQGSWNDVVLGAGPDTCVFGSWRVRANVAGAPSALQGNAAIPAWAPSEVESDGKCDTVLLLRILISLSKWPHLASCTALSTTAC